MHRLRLLPYGVPVQRAEGRSLEGPLRQVRRVRRPRGRRREAGVRRGLPGSRAGLRHRRGDERSRPHRRRRAAARPGLHHAEPVHQAFRGRAALRRAERQGREPAGGGIKWKTQWLNCLWQSSPPWCPSVPVRSSCWRSRSSPRSSAPTS